MKYIFYFIKIIYFTYITFFPFGLQRLEQSMACASSMPSGKSRMKDDTWNNCEKRVGCTISIFVISFAHSRD